jgi:hypothetical protein
MQSTTSLQVPEQFAGIYGLGSPLQVFPAGQSTRWVSAIGGVIFLGIAGLAILYGLYDTFVQTTQNGPVKLGETLFPALIISGFFGLFGLMMAINAYLNWNKAVVLYQNGLAYNDSKGVQTWNWQDVDRFFVAITKHYYNGIYTGTTHQYTLQKADGTKLKLDNKLQKVETLGTAIGRGVAPAQYQKLVTAIRNGQTVALGPIAISNDGVAFGKKVYPWKDVEQVGIQKGYVSVKKRGGGWFSGASAPVAAIPNLDALLAVVDQVVKIKAG